MKLSRKFVNDYTNIEDIETEEYAEKLVRLGHEHDSISTLVSASKVIIGEVIKCEKMEESDHLHTCKVNIGEKVLNIVCGAPNVREGLKVIVALPGCELPLGTIKEGVILGHESCGMLCSLAELGVENKYLSEEDIKGIHEMDKDAIVGTDPIKALELDDTVIDLELTANRGDMQSILGLAYESSIITGEEVRIPEIDYKETNEDVSSKIKLNVESENVYTFLIKRVDGIKIGESPLWMKNRLMACGVRPINNVVDISNYVMLETGNPMHFYDADKLGSEIGARNAKDGETIVTLDGMSRILTSEDIVITNGKDPVCLAGVMGGEATEVTDETKNILIECAIFAPGNIRKTSKKLLRSESSIRYEKGLDVNRTYLAIERACTLLSKYADGKVLKGMIEYNTLDREPKKINISLGKINSVLGFALSMDDVKLCFEKLKFDIKVNGEDIEVTVPTRRIDISIVEDLIEEIARVYGVDNMKSTLPVYPSAPGKIDMRNRIVRDKMINLGLTEVITYSLIKNSDLFKFSNDEFGVIRVNNPMSEDRTTLRHSIINSLVEVYNYNKARGNKEMGIFEIGRGFSSINGEYIEETKLAALMTGVYSEGLENLKYDFYVLKGIIEDLLDYLGYKGRYSFVVKELPEEMHPTKSAYIVVSGKIVGLMGQVHPSICKEEVYVFEMNLDHLFENKTGRIKVKEITKFPGISKDAAFVVDKKVTNEELIAAIKQGAGKLLKEVKLFDYYEGDIIEKDKKSLAYSLYFESNEKTLSDEEVLPLFNKAIETTVKKCNAALRDK